MSVLKKSQLSLRAWTNQKWRTNSGKPSSKTGERYLPEKAWKSLTAKEKAATNQAKKEGGGTGNVVKQPKSIADKVRKYRKKYTEGTTGIKTDNPGKGSIASKPFSKLPVKKQTDLPITAEEEQRLRLTSDFPDSEKALSDYLKDEKIDNKYRSYADPSMSKDRQLKRLTELQNAREYALNWVNKRVSTNPKIQKELEQVKSQKIKNIDLVQTYVNKSNATRSGAYSSKYKDVEIVDENADEFTANHEMSHASDDSGNLLTKGEKDLIEKSVNPTQKFRDDNRMYGISNAYFTEPTEVKARVQVLRKAMNLKPTEVVTKERLKQGIQKNSKVKNVNELIQTVPDEGKLLELMNQLGSTKSTQSKIQKAKKGIKRVKL